MGVSPIKVVYYLTNQECYPTVFTEIEARIFRFFVKYISVQRVYLI